MFFENMVRIPLIIRLPNDSRPGQTSEALVELIDLYPTILELTGCEIPKYRDGVSLLPLVRGEVDCIRDEVLGEVHVHTMIRTAEWKYVAGDTGEGLQLFDLVSDPREQRNLAGHPDYGNVETEMRNRMLTRLLRSQHHSTDRDPAFSAHTSVS